MKRIASLALLYAGFAGCSDACYILSEDVACEIDTDCPGDVPFCVDKIDRRVCNANLIGPPCTVSADCNEATPFCTTDPDGERFCTDFCDAENTCDNDVGEFCFELACTVDVGCDDDSDCFSGNGSLDRCLIDPQLPLSCVVADAETACSVIDDAGCVTQGMLCEIEHYAFCMDAQSAQGRCDIALQIPRGPDAMLFVGDAFIPGDCATCVDVQVIYLELPNDLVELPPNEFMTQPFNAAVLGPDGATTSNTIVDVTVNDFNDTFAEVTFRIESDRVADEIAISIGTQSIEDGGAGLTSSACFDVP